MPKNDCYNHDWDARNDCCLDCESVTQSKEQQQKYHCQPFIRYWLYTLSAEEIFFFLSTDTYSFVAMDISHWKNRAEVITNTTYW